METDSQALRFEISDNYRLKGIIVVVVLEELQTVRQAKGYSIHMVAELLKISVDSYLELEYVLREASDQEMDILDRIFGE